MQIKLDPEKITLDDLIYFEDGSPSLRFTRDFLARFVTDGKGHYLPPAEAQQKVGALNLAELKTFTAQIKDAMGDLTGMVVPPDSGGS
jgi:hypothetical protein